MIVIVKKIYVEITNNVAYFILFPYFYDIDSSLSLNVLISFPGRRYRTPIFFLEYNVFVDFNKYRSNIVEITNNVAYFILFPYFYDKDSSLSLNVLI